MKLTPWKVARVLRWIPEEDRAAVRKEFAEKDEIIDVFDEESGETHQRKKGISSETISRVMRMHNAVSPMKNKEKGAFGKKGTNRKMQLFHQRLVMAELFEKAKKEVEDGIADENQDQEDQPDSVRDS